MLHELKPWQGVQHAVMPEEIGDWIKLHVRVLPPDGHDFKMKLKEPTEMSTKELTEAILNAGLGSKAVGLMEKSEFIKLVQDHRNSCSRS